MSDSSTVLTWSAELGKRRRTGDWQDQTISTVEKITQAISHRSPEVAAELVDYFMEEAKICHKIYVGWEQAFDEWLVAEGVMPSEVTQEKTRLASLLCFPDGEDFDPHARWERLGAQAGILANRLRAEVIDLGEAAAETELLREAWRQLHDRWVDYAGGFLTFIAKRFGEPAIERCYRYIMEPLVQERYMPYDTRVQPYEDTIDRNLYYSLEAMRAHLSGPGRRGDLELQEHADRWEIRFDPCGSGGAQTRGDEVEGTPPRPEPPYSFGITEEEHDWAWNKKGICYYCAHCCFALELLPIERWGSPVRVVDPPQYDRNTQDVTPRKCQWTIFKSVDDIPDHVYQRVGHASPRGIGSRR
jgi:hypothetical protein